jgi:hypothetical protein
VAGLYALMTALLQLAVGLLFAALVTDCRGQVTRGFLFIAAATASGAGWLAFSLSGLVGTEGLERVLQAVLLASLLVYTLLVGVPRLPRVVRLGLGFVALGFGLAVLSLAAEQRPSPILGPLLTAWSSWLSALALGAAIGGLLLGHWYLVTPKLSARPLRLLCDLLLASLVPLTALAAWYLLLEAGGIGTPAGPGGLSGAPLWVGAGMMTLFPFGVTIAARSCCVDGPGRGRSLQAATGLLYLVAAAVLAGGLAGNAVLVGA